MEDDECIHGLAPGTCSLCRPRPKRVAPAPRPTTAPRTPDDPIAPLNGSKDISVPVHAVEPYLNARTDWLVPQGYPHDLRPGGWVYLRCDGRLAARVRVVAMRWRDERPRRTGDIETEEGFGAGLVFGLDPDTWEPFDQSLGDDADRMRQGYRYHLTDRSGVVHHFTVEAKIPEGDWETDD